MATKLRLVYEHRYGHLVRLMASSPLSLIALVPDDVALRQCPDFHEDIA